MPRRVPLPTSSVRSPLSIRGASSAAFRGANALDQLEDAESSGDRDRIRAVREWLDLGLPDWRDKLEAHRVWLTGPEPKRA